MNAKQIKWILVLVIMVLAGWYLYPSIKWYRYTPKQREEKEKNQDKIVNKIINLGLDLKGGMHLVLEVDKTKIPKGTTLNDAMDRAIEILRNRIDQFGVAEPLIQKQGDNLILVQLPGVKDTQRAIDLIGQTALLEFKLVDDTNKLNDAIQGKIPEGYELVKDQHEDHILLKKEALLTGAALSNAKVKIGGQYNMPYIGIDFTEQGAKDFAKLTGDNINRRLAIVLDGVVQSAPVIKSRIPDGHAIIEGNFTMEDASGLAIVLRAGALPAPVNIIENRTIGPSLGQDSIKAGLKACLIGLTFVVIFMAIYYGLSGLVANLAVILNLIVLMAAMAAFHATLTLPGIAGVILALGMAVDANVLIFERIREELRVGKTIRVAIDTGYEKAFSAIIDSNLTTLIAAAFLFQFGTGPVKGFAVTLTLGITISMFTAIVVTHLIFDYALAGKDIKKLSI
ncbi:MAG: protein translocase subunit SecD [Elusimicrobia bacterium]|nr:protein translocase subunit SecD [Elusimicrobiota bacterium]